MVLYSIAVLKYLISNYKIFKCLLQEKNIYLLYGIYLTILNSYKSVAKASITPNQKYVEIYYLKNSTLVMNNKLLKYVLKK